MHRIEAGQTYTTCRGGPTSCYPETVTVRSYTLGDRTVEVTGGYGGAPGRHVIPASYFHATARTAVGRRRITGYYLTG
ncbi:hypothetical protein [Kitasatospora sp. NPDC006786]|uniref:hypothetical protein n=1 Tax=unclassified Kitasatospora TaxID=2633591 RepID=UPI0033FAA6D6